LEAPLASRPGAWTWWTQGAKRLEASRLIEEHRPDVVFSRRADAGARAGLPSSKKAHGPAIGAKPGKDAEPLAAGGVCHGVQTNIAGYVRGRTVNASSRITCELRYDQDAHRILVRYPWAKPPSVNGSGIFAGFRAVPVP